MSPIQTAVYGEVPRDLIEVAAGSVQCSPRCPGSASLADFAPSSLAAVVMHAPPGTVERRAAIAHALKTLAPSGMLTVFAGNTKGGTRLGGELTAFGCPIETSHKRRHQFVSSKRPETVVGVEDAIAAGAPRHLPELDLWSQPGLFNWDRVDPGSQLLLDHLPVLSGRGADLGCGIGVLARAVRTTPKPADMVLIDIDCRALDIARRNVPGDGVTTLWADVRAASGLPAGLDFVVTNPPFHDAGEEDKSLGQTFITKAAGMLRPGGVLWLTANRHLPYEATLKPLFETVEAVAQAHGYKIYAARKSAIAANAPPKKVRR